MDDFTPQNKIQRYAHENRGIVSQAEFERSLGLKPWKVARTTARYWWLYGMKQPELSNLKLLASFLRVSIDDLVN